MRSLRRLGFLWAIMLPVVVHAWTPIGPRYRLTNESNRTWLVDPAGKPFFSLGACVLTQGTTRDAYDPENPAYAAWQHYPTPVAWADESLSRLKAWGFTTVGGWADTAVLRQSSNQALYLTPVLHIGSTAGAPWWDMWDPKNAVG